MESVANQQQDETGKHDVWVTLLTRETMSGSGKQLSSGGGVQPVPRQETAASRTDLGTDGNVCTLLNRSGNRPRFSAPKPLSGQLASCHLP